MLGDCIVHLRYDGVGNLVRDSAEMSQTANLQTAKKRCVCGRSTSFPLCDGSHQNQGWQCSVVAQVPANMVFVAGPHLVNLADRLAHRFGGVSLNAINGEIRTASLVILCDGADVQWLHNQISRVEAEQVRVIGVGVSIEVLQWAFPDYPCVTISDEKSTSLWRLVVSEVSTEPEKRNTKNVPPKVFVSHAVADEGLLFPVLDVLRKQYGVELFVCADSIPVGDTWHDEIRRQLSTCDVFLLISSPAVVKSTYCAFEVGIATALDKPIRVIALQEDATPSYVAHLQGICVERLLLRKPWLSPDEGLLDAMLDILGAQY